MKSPIAKTLSGAALLLLIGCSKAPEQDAPVLRVADQLYFVQAAVGAAGEGDPANYRIQWSNFIGGPPIIAAQTGGSVDVGWMAETPLVYAQAAGSPVKVVAVSRGTAHNASNIALVVKADSPIHSVADLKGKKVGVMVGTVAQYLLVRALDQAGLSFKDITPVQATVINGAILDHGTVDALITAEPTLSQDLGAGKIRVLAYGGQPNTPGFGYLVASDAALKDPKKVALIGDFITRVARATRWQHANVEKAAPTTAKAFNISPALAAKILARTPIHYVPIDANIIATHQAEADEFHKLGLVKQVDAKALFDTRFNPLVAQLETNR